MKYTLYKKVPFTPKLEHVVTSKDMFECLNVLPHAALSSVAFLPEQDIDEMLHEYKVGEYIMWLTDDAGGHVTEIFSCKIWLPAMIES